MTGTFMVALFITLGLLALTYLPWWPRALNFDLKVTRHMLIINQVAFTIGWFLMGVPSFFVMLCSVACQVVHQVALRVERRRSCSA